MVTIPMFVMLWIAIKALGKLLVVVLLVAILNFKIAAASRFQNGRHFQHILAYILISELPRKLIMFMMLRIVIKALGKLLFAAFLAAILDLISAPIFKIFWPIFKLLRTLKMVAILVFMMLRIAIKALGKLRFIIPWAINLDSKKPSLLTCFGLYLNFSVTYSLKWWLRIAIKSFRKVFYPCHNLKVDKESSNRK